MTKRAISLEQWRAIDVIVQAARQRPANERAAFVVEACGNDEILKVEVESLLATNTGGDFLDLSRSSLDTTGRLSIALAGRYVVARELGRGGMATVYLAHDLKHDRDVAIKVLHPELGAALGAERFLKEIAVTAKLHHPHILPLYDSGHAAGLLYYVMPFVEGETLRARLERERQLPVGDAATIAREVASALDYAHRNGVIHRDIKPENILLQDGNALVADFGIALAVKEAGGERMTLTGFSLGTPQYMAPEQAVGERQLDARVDVYSLGVVLFEMLAGEPPLKGTPGAIIARRLAEPAPSLRKAGRVVPEQLERVVARSLERVSADRFATAADFVRALEGEPMPSRRPVWRRSRIATGIGFAAAIGLAVVVARGIDSRRNQTIGNTAVRPPRGTRDSIARDRVAKASIQADRRSAENLERSVALYTEAIARDSNYADAWAGLARALSFSSIWRYPLTKVGIPPESLQPQMVRASERALEADDRSANAWLARAATLRIVDPTSRRGLIEAAHRAVRIDSTSADAWFQLGGALADSLDLMSSVAAYRRAVAIDPRHVNALAFLGFDYLWMRNNDSALVWADSATAVDASAVLGRQSLGVIRLARKQWTEAQAEFGAIVSLGSGSERIHGWAGLAELASRRGSRRAADTLVAHAVAIADTLHPTVHDAAYLAWAYAATGRRERALRLLERFEPRFDEHFQLHLQGDPTLDPLRSDPRFVALLRRGPVLHP